MIFLRFYLKVIETFYVKNEFKKFQNVISKFFLFFAFIGVEHSTTYNKIIEVFSKNMKNSYKNQRIFKKISIIFERINFWKFSML